jgi:hypothetical protein
MPIAAIADSLPLAVGVALSPLPIAAVVSVLLSSKPGNAVGFLLGWMAGIVAVGALIFLVPGLETARGDPTPLSGWVRLGAGVIALALAVFQWRSRPSDDEPAEMPKMLSSLDSAGTGKTIYIGFALSAINPKNLLLTSTGATYIYAAVEAPADMIIAFAIYATVASASVIVPIIGHSLFREQMQSKLDGWKQWLIRNNAGVMTALLTVIGALIIGDGLKILF